jgi:hypothetical protein
MKTFKELDITGWESITDLVLDYCQRNKKIYNREDGRSLIELPVHIFYKIKPMIDSKFKEYSIVSTKVFVYVMYEDHQGVLHSDNSLHFARINFPVLNCENTYTEFYSVDKSELFTNSKYIIKLPSEDAEVTLVDRVEIKRPPVLNVNHFHIIVLNNTARYPRITLSVKFDKDPYFLL